MMRVSTSLDLMTRMVHGLKPLWIEAGNMETALLSGRLRSIPIDRPIFVTGLARSGSTLLLEFIAAHAGVATHQYRDFPFIFTPYASRKLTSLLSRHAEKKERAHGDRIMVSPQSPEAMEEMLWQVFPEHGKDFAEFYSAHIRKLLLTAQAQRYAAKNNNLATRLPELLKLFPDARIIVPVRDPLAHIGSLMRQHRRFMQEANHPRAIRHLRAQGHDEFGPIRHWQHPDEIAGWAAEWNRVYSHVLPYLGQANILCVPFEKLCAAPREWLKKVAHHAELADAPMVLESFVQRIAAPDYYTPDLSEADTARIRNLTHEINTIFTKTGL